MSLTRLLNRQFKVHKPIFPEKIAQNIFDCLKFKIISFFGHLISFVANKINCTRNFKNLSYDFVSYIVRRTIRSCTRRSCTIRIVQHNSFLIQGGWNRI
jgi:hypothetical protein